MNVVAVIPIAKGQWENIHYITEPKAWVGFYFFEVVLDWSLFEGCRGKLYVETIHNKEHGGVLRLAYQQKPANMIPVVGSEIVTRDTSGVRWQLLESDWFDLPVVEGVSCVWVQGKAGEGLTCSLALATLVIAK